MTTAYFLLIFIRATVGGPIEHRSVQVATPEACIEMGTDMGTKLRNSASVQSFVLSCAKIEMSDKLVPHT